MGVVSGYSEGVRIERLIRRIFAKVDVGDCWLWTGYKNSLDYGQLYLDGRSVLAHRAVWQVLVGPIAPKLELDHLCRVPACVNPDHLEPVTHRENVRRGIAGVVSGARKLAITQCPQGHAYDDVNTSRASRTGYRTCRTCARTREAARRVADPERIRARDRARYAANPEVFRDRSRAVRAREATT